MLIIPDEREILEEFLNEMYKFFSTWKFPLEESFTQKVLLTKEDDYLFFPGVKKLHFNAYFFKLI